MLNLMGLRNDIEERYGVVTHLDEYIGNDAISFQNNGYKFIVYIKPKEFFGSDVYRYSISHGKKMFGCGASVLDEQSLFKVLNKYIKTVNVQGRLF